MSPFLHLQGYSNATRSNTDHPDRALWCTCTTLLTWHGVQEIYCASVSNIASAVAGTTDLLGSEAFILWLPGLQMAVHHTKAGMELKLHLFQVASCKSSLSQ